ncbi:MAG: hypothetical protein KF893_14825, partial [Caldilineaceae bacterium]|nr:hypothetical protein [Caldilineaceae bacterium]
MYKRTLLTLFAFSIVLIAANSYLSSSSAVAQFFSPLPTPSNPNEPIQPTPTPILTEEAEVALRYFSETYSVPPEQVRVGQAAVISLPVTGRTIWQANVEDYAGKQSVIVTIDLDSGSIVDGEAVRQAEQEAHVKKYGKLEPELHEHLQAVQESELTTVTIWFNVDIEKIRSEVIARYPDAKLYGFQPSDETDSALYEKIYQEMVAAEQQAYKEHAAAIVSELQKSGAEILYVDQFAPVLEAKLTKQMILDIAANDAVTNIYLSSVLQPLLDTTGPTGRFPVVWRRGITGSNIKVAVIEAEGIYFDHDYLPNGTYCFTN